MQQTSLDNWIKRKYVFCYGVLLSTLPSRIPAAAKVEPAEHASYRFLVVCVSEEQFNALIDTCRHEMISYAPHIRNRTGMVAHLLCPPNHDSFTMRLFWNMLRIAAVGWLSIITCGSILVSPLLKIEGLAWLRVLLRFLPSFITRGVCFVLALGTFVFSVSAKEPDFSTDSDLVPLPDWSSRDATPEGGGASSAAFSYKVVKRVSASPSGATEIPVQAYESIEVGICSPTVTLSSGRNSVIFHIHDSAAASVELTRPAAGAVPAIKAYRIALGGGIEQLTLAGNSLTVITPTSTTSSVIVTYAVANILVVDAGKVSQK